ncbi:MAG: proteasome-activating nucleotidase [Candidatus Thermoplasmatota archaeon]|nr:proteasome-activating nucleotidase [Candidatus Thermoplasmatota archaeon]
MRTMTSDGDVLRPGGNENTRKAEDDMIKLQKEFRELHENVQRITTEKMQLERDLDGIRKIAHRLEDEVNSLRSPPLIIGHLQDMISEKTGIVRSSNGTVFKVSVNPAIPENKLKPGARVTLNQDTLAIIDVLQDGWDPLVTGAEVGDKPTITFDEIGGLDEQIKLLREAIELPLQMPELFSKVGIKPPKGVLLTGPPGCGKTMIAKAVAANADATFIQLVGSELAQKYIGEGGRMVRELFALAQEKAPAIIFIDEIDAIGAKRLDTATSGDREVQRTLMQLLAELDGFNPLDSVKIIAATNRPDILDDALLRPGRFDRIIEIPLPNEEARKGIFKINIENMNSSKLSIKNIIAATEGFSGADIKAMCVEAGMEAIRDRREKVLAKDFTAALKITEKMRKNAENEKINTLYA